MINAYYFYRLSHWFYQWRIPLLPQIIKGVIFLIYNSSIPYQCKIGKGSRFAYGGIATLIHKKAEIGQNCNIGVQVVLGGRSGNEGVPKIGNNVMIGAGAKVLGAIEIGDDVQIGANAVVLQSVPKGCVVAGVPAKIIKTEKA